ncbi:acyl-CoA dehydrogenase family protein [Streptosporangium carneum]|uniref:Dibenzothiophene monooxygenase n=1 Tax=Streptosporangium carneum TaxID=47481 RepID=A0A9W6I878_9ACTN|nr:acyl-CoA dehydrogenase family protein [Streptosporangium carneum]GLK13890.1 oxidoreductase [Streptosporangium carneum]
MSADPGPFDELWPDVGELMPADALERFAAGAARADESGRPCPGSLDLLRETGWPALAIPTAFQGRGAGLLESCAAQRLLGQADPALAVAVNMHIFTIGLTVEHWRRNTDVSWLLIEAIATQNRLVASAFAEPHLGGSATRSTLVAERVPGGWEVTGRKYPCSLASEADLVCLQVAAPARDGGSPQILVAMLPTNAPGLSVVENWDAMGMRGSASNTLVLDRCVIPDELVFYQAPAGAEDDDVLAAGVIWFSLTATAVYLGLAESALRVGRRLLGAQRIAHLGSARADLPSYQAVLGDPYAALLTLEAGCVAVAGRMDARADPQRLLPAALAVKQQAVHTVPALVAAIAEACGGASYARQGELARLWRDAQAIRFHPPTPVAARQFLGRRALGVPASLDLDECAPSLTSPPPTSKQ